MSIPILALYGSLVTHYVLKVVLRVEYLNNILKENYFWGTNPNLEKFLSLKILPDTNKSSRLPREATRTKVLIELFLWYPLTKYRI